MRRYTPVRKHEYRGTRFWVESREGSFEGKKEGASILTRWDESEELGFFSLRTPKTRQVCDHGRHPETKQDLLNQRWAHEVTNFSNKDL